MVAADVRDSDSETLETLDFSDGEATDKLDGLGDAMIAVAEIKVKNTDVACQMDGVGVAPVAGTE